MHHVVPVLRELIEDQVPIVPGEDPAGIVDLLDVALRARRAVDVPRIDHPLLEPVEAFPAHGLGQHRNRPAPQEPRDRNAPAAVVAGRGPHGTVTRHVEGSGEQVGNEASVRGQHLVGADHRESVAQCHDDPGRHPGERSGQHDVLGDVDQRPAIRAVVPMDAEEVAGIRAVGIDPGNLFGPGRQTRWRVGQVRDAGQRHAERPQVSHVPSLAVNVERWLAEHIGHIRPRSNAVQAGCIAARRQRGFCHGLLWLLHGEATQQRIVRLEVGGPDQPCPVAPPNRIVAASRSDIGFAVLHR